MKVEAAFPLGIVLKIPIPHRFVTITAVVSAEIGGRWREAQGRGVGAGDQSGTALEGQVSPKPVERDHEAVAKPVRK